MSETNEIVNGAGETQDITKDGELTDADFNKVSGGFGSNEHGAMGGRVNFQDIHVTKKIDVSSLLGGQWRPPDGDLPTEAVQREEGATPGQLSNNRYTGPMRLARTDLGTGDPMLFLHGFPCTRLLWQPVMERISQAGFRCIAPDLLGYGASPSDEDVGMAAQVPHLLALLDELKLEKVDLIAHDVGTAAAQLIALQHPQRLKRLVLMDGVYETEWAIDAIESIRIWDVEKSSRLQPVLTRRLKPIRDLLAAYYGEEGGKQLIHAARCLDPSQTQGATARLRKIGLPISIIWGVQDEYLPLKTVGRPLAVGLGVDVIVVDGGHFLPLDNPEGTAKAILESVQSLSAHARRWPAGTVQASAERE